MTGSKRPIDYVTSPSLLECYKKEQMTIILADRHFQANSTLESRIEWYTSQADACARCLLELNRHPLRAAIRRNQYVPTLVLPMSCLLIEPLNGTEQGSELIKNKCEGASLDTARRRGYVQEPLPLHRAPRY